MTSSSRCRSAGSRLVVLAAVASALALGACGNAQGVADTQRALERSGYRDVDISLRSGGNVDVARVEAAGDSPPAVSSGGSPPAVPSGGSSPAVDAAAVVWRTLPVRFDQLVVALGAEITSFGYEELAGRFGPREAALDRRQVDQEVVESGLKLMLLLSVAAALSVGAVVAVGLLGLRAARRARQEGARD